MEVCVSRVFTQWHHKGHTVTLFTPLPSPFSLPNNLLIGTAFASSFSLALAGAAAFEAAAAAAVEAMVLRVTNATIGGRSLCTTFPLSTKFATLTVLGRRFQVKLSNPHFSQCPCAVLLLLLW